MANHGRLAEAIAHFTGRHPNRRRFLRTGAVAAAFSSAARPALTGPFNVGVGRGTDAYETTNRAIQACGEWGALNLAGNVVVIKPNLVKPALPDVGATTDAQVVRALVDKALASGAAFVVIVEADPFGSTFSSCGYGFFDTYDAAGRVRVGNLLGLETALVPLNGWIYRSIYSYPLVLNRSYVFISVAKLKMHAEALATLGAKNMFGMPAMDRYVSSPPIGRFAMHDRGMNQAAVDNYLLRPPDFTVIDGMVGMEGLGPSQGDPVVMNHVLAGRNTLAVDRVGLAAMNLGQYSVPHLNYMTLLGLGPASLSDVNLLGDTLAPKTFRRPPTLPVRMEAPWPAPAAFSLTASGSTSVQVKYYDGCQREVTVLRVSDETTQTELIRTLIPLSPRGPGSEVLTWNGMTETGTPVPPGRYAVHVRAYRADGQSRVADAMNWVSVQA